MHDERLDPEVGRLLRTARRAAFATPAPAPDDRLTALFAAGAVADAIPVVETLPARRRSSVKQLLSNLPAKVAAGVLGAGLAIGGLGVAGALPGNILLASSHHDEQVTTSDQQATTTTEAPEVEKDSTDAKDSTQTADTPDQPKTTTPTDLSTVAVPTSVSEAAQTHAFDEACGNHGAYVSYFAQNGTEPDCATTARAAAVPGSNTQQAQQTATTSSGTTSSGPSTHGKSGSTHGKSAASSHASTGR